MSGNVKAALAVSDVMVQSRLREATARLGHEAVVADTTDALRDALDTGATVVIVDLRDAAFAWREVLAEAHRAGARLLAFGPHVEAALLREARAAGCDRVVPRSALIEALEKFYEPEP